MSRCYPFPPDTLYFRIEPEGRSHYFHCYVWGLLRDMRAYIRAEAPTTHAYKAHAFTVGYDVVTRAHPRGLLGELHFASKYLEIDLISHEALHAVTIWGARRKVGDDLEAEERRCYALGRLCGQITGTLERYGYALK